ncbi:MAG TPA: response regulator, partial [Polyangiaceae bacterium LLY-WYZ-14_1]|nr:response regulator [Polyangiaceae bacterium LLY-WYZ-14_1]
SRFRTASNSLPPPPRTGEHPSPDWDLRHRAAVLDQVSDAIVSISLDRRIRSWNRAAEALFGWPPEEARTRRVEEVLWAPGGGEPRPSLLVDQVAASGEEWRGDLPVRHRDGEVLRVVAHLSRLVDDEGAPVGMLFVFRDVRAQRRNAEALRHTEDQLHRAQRLEALGRLAAGMAHDFNNTLSVIYGSAQFIGQGLAEGDPKREDLRAIQDAVKSASTLTQQLLAFGRGQTLALEPLDVDGTIGETQRMLRRVIGDDIALRTELRSGGARIRADRGRLQQVLVNLAVNARDAMREGGTLLIETRVVAAGDAASSSASSSSPASEASPAAAGPVPDRSVVLRVADDGIGMDEETRARLFEPFFTTKAEGQGTGLGLAVVYGIVTQLGGEIRVDSTLGVGTAFEIRLPLLSEGGAVRQPTLAPPSEPGGAIGPASSLLVVEDDERVRASMTRILRHQGFGVLEAGDAHEALALVEADPACVDVVLTDVVMPQMSGTALVEALRRTRPTLPVVYVTGYVDGPGAAALEAEGGPPVVTKPFTVADLLSAIRRAARKEEAPEASAPRRLPGDG